MKKLNKIIVVVICLTGITLPQSKFFIGGTGVYSLPIGAIGERIKGAVGGNVNFGILTSEDWIWGGKFEYIKYGKTAEGLERRVKSDVTGSLQEYTFPLKNLEMNLTTFSFMAETKLKALDAGVFNAYLTAGFGFAYWKFSRNEYRDSLKIDPAGDGNLVLVEVLNTPGLDQEDWSGIANIGFELDYLIAAPLSINFSANYKLLIGELWPTLNLNIENVSGMQFVDIRGGIRIHL